MAILRSTQVKGDLSVTGSLNVQGNLTYVGVENLRVKDKQIELNATDSGSAVVSGLEADQAGIVFKGTTKNDSAEASILYNWSNDTLKVNKTIEGTVSNATTATSADKVAQKLTVNVTDETGSLKTVEFDGSEVKTVDVNLKGLQDQINSLTGGAGSIATQINDAISKLNSDVTATASGNADKDGVFVLQSVRIDESAGKLTSATPTAVEVEKAGAAAAAKTELIGKDTDTADSATIKGAKKYADSLAGNYAAASHTHEIDDVNGLQTALDGKAAEVHTHVVADITDLSGELAKKQDNLSADQLKAVNSGVTAERLSGYDAHVANTTIHVTEEDKVKWNGIEQKANTYTDNKIGELGTAAKSNVLTGAIADSSSDDLVTAAQVKAYAAGVVGAMHFRGAVESTGSVANPASGDICLVGTKEYVHNGTEWVLFGDETAYDIKGAADEAEQKAKTYADGLNIAMDTRVQALEAIDHTHANKEELDKIAVGDKAKWDDAAAKAHIHANKSVLDGITADKVKAWESAASASVVNSVGGKSGALTLKSGSKVLGDVNLSISDGGQISAAIVPNSFDSFGSAATALSTAIGTDDDDENADTIKGAKKYADSKVAELNTTVNSLSAEALKNVAAGTYVSVSPKSGNSQTISVTTEDVATASDTPKGLALAADVKKYVDGKNADQDTKIANIENGKTLDSRYVNADGDTMTGKLTMNAADIEMPSNGLNGIIFGNMKIVWKDNAIEFIPTTA